METSISKPMRGIAYAWEGQVDQMRAALGKCITALCFELEQAISREDPVAVLQINDALHHAREALK